MRRPGIFSFSLYERLVTYNKLFSKILDSSIWLEPTPTRIVWLTFIAVMDEDGYAHFASLANLAHRARVTLGEAKTAVQVLESPDKDSSDPDNSGRRIERVPGGWMILNAEKHREMVTRDVIREQTKNRMKRYRERLENDNAVTRGNGKLRTVTHVTESDENVTISEAVSESGSRSKARSEANKLK